MAIFQPKVAQKWPFMAKIPNPFILIQYDYALRAGVNILRNSERIKLKDIVSHDEGE